MAVLECVRVRRAVFHTLTHVRRSKQNCASRLLGPRSAGWPGRLRAALLRAAVHTTYRKIAEKSVRSCLKRLRYSLALAASLATSSASSSLAVRASMSALLSIRRRVTTPCISAVMSASRCTRSARRRSFSWSHLKSAALRDRAIGVDLCRRQAAAQVGAVAILFALVLLAFMLAAAFDATACRCRAKQARQHGVVDALFAVRGSAD
eukprot:6190736-Pleurochrysis_carterae.AAC.2